MLASPPVAASRRLRLPFLTFSPLPACLQHVGGLVTVVGRVKETRGDQVYLEGSCGGDICIERDATEPYKNQFVEVLPAVPPFAPPNCPCPLKVCARCAMSDRYTLPNCRWSAQSALTAQ